MKHSGKAFVSVILLFSFALVLFAASSNFITVSIQGLPCPFCVNNLKNKLNNVPGVANAEISSDNKSVQLSIESDKKPDVNEIRKAIIDSGFTPISISSSNKKMSHLSVKNKPCAECHTNK